MFQKDLTFFFFFFFFLQDDVAPAVPPADQIPSSTLWVGNINFNVVGEDEVRSLFMQYGMVESMKTLPHKNCAFVNFSSKEDAWRCMTSSMRQGMYLGGVQLKTGWGKPQDRVEERSVVTSPPSNSVWIGSLPADTEEEELRSIFSRFGHVENVRLILPKRCAFLTLSSVSDAEMAIRELQGYNFRGERLKLNFGTPQPLQQNRQHRRMDEEIRLAPVPQCDPPSNPDIQHVIDSLASYVHRLGISFEEKVKDLQKGNPRFEFLFGGVGHDYYAWRKYELKEEEAQATSHLAPWQRAYGQNNNNNASSGGGGGGATDELNAILSSDEVAELHSLLRRLQPTQDSIRNSKDWVMSRSKAASDLVSHIKSFLVEGDVAGFSGRLNVLYLVNDVLLHSSRAAKEGKPDYFSPAFQRSLGDLLKAVLDHAQSQDERGRVIDLVQVWKSKEFYPQEFLQELIDGLDDARPSKKQRGNPWDYN